MRTSLKLNTGNARAPLQARADDLYETPEVATHALLSVEHFEGVIWECACGPGKIVEVLRGHGHRVYATDLVDYGCEESEHRVDFLMERQPAVKCGAIVTNPPFKLANEFVAHALTMGVPKVAMLLRLAFLEGGSNKLRNEALDGGKLARVHVFRKRIPMMHRAGWEGRKASSGMAFAWFVWELAHRGPAELRRLSWEAACGSLNGAQPPGLVEHRPLQEQGSTAT